jgi:hypothetical protein
LLLILVAVALLVLGLADGSSVLLISSIAASLLAAVALVMGAREAAAVRAAVDDEFGRRPSDEGGDQASHRWAGRGGPLRPPATTERAESVKVTVPAQHGPGASTPDSHRWGQPGGPSDGRGAEPAGRNEPVDDGSWPDEPAAQYVAPADAARLARMLAEVRVVDGRPRYHLSGCPQLQGRHSVPMPVREAVELGFTPCGRCEPNTALLADARRG